MELLGLLAHVDDVVLTEHLGGVSLVTTRSAEGLACNIQMDSDGFNLATNIQMDSTCPQQSDGLNLACNLFTLHEDRQKKKLLKVCDSASPLNLNPSIQLQIFWLFVCFFFLTKKTLKVLSPARDARV